MLKIVRSFLIATSIFCLFTASDACAANLPLGFSEEIIGNSWNEVVGLRFAPDGRMYAWEKGGRVWTVDNNGVKSTVPLVDISEEVGNWYENGMLGFALDPDFINNGYIYLLYVVDRHHLLHCREDASGAGQPICDAAYNPNANEPFAATIGRVTRYQAVKPASDADYRNATTVDYASRRVLIGETLDSGFPVLYISHGAGTLLFGADGSLIVSFGDSASAASIDTGSDINTYWQDAAASGIIRPKENVGSYRAQLVDSLNGKIVRIDPATGNGLASNPFFDANAPRAPRSRVWSLGLRNPFRVTLRPGTGSPVIGDGNPGVFYIGDVGSFYWEELDIARSGGRNFGWPLFEGMQNNFDFTFVLTANMDAPNPLFDGISCRQQFLNFQDLIIQDTLNPNRSWTNPCNPGVSLPPSLNLFIHSRPVVDWGRPPNPARWSAYSGWDPIQPNIGTAAPDNRIVPGPQFGGATSIGGVWYTGDRFPAQYRNTYFHGDYSAGWIRNFVFDGNDRLLEVRNFIDNAVGVVTIAAHPLNGSLYYVDWTSQIFKVSYSANDSSDLSLAPAQFPNPAYVGQPLYYWAQIKNNGPTSATGVVFTDAVPTDLHPQYAPYTTQGTCSISGSTVRCELGTIAPGASAWVVVYAQPSAVATLTNTMSVNAATLDPDLGNNTGSVTTQVVIPVADVGLTQYTGPNPGTGTVGGLLYYVAQVTNNGPAPATNVVVTDFVPTALHPLYAPYTTQGTCGISGSTVRCELGTIAPGASAWVVVYAQPSAAGTLTNTMSVNAATFDPDSRNNTGIVTVQVVIPVADVGIIQYTGPNPGTGTVGGLLYYIAQVTNNGPATATNVVVTDFVPTALHPLYAPFATQGTCSTSGGSVRCDLGTLAPAASAWVAVYSLPTQSATVTNTISVSTTAADPNFINNSSTVRMVVTR